MIVKIIYRDGKIEEMLKIESVKHEAGVVIITDRYGSRYIPLDRIEEVKTEDSRGGW